MLAIVHAATVHVLGAIAWNPEIRNILALLVGFVVLMGSVYLIVGSNVGARTGFLIAVSGLMGWCTLMGVFWWIYGNVGMVGQDAKWRVVEINYSADGYSGLDDAALPDARALSGLDSLPTAAEIIHDHPELVDEILPADLTPEDKAARALTITIGQILEADPDLIDADGFNGGVGNWDLLSVSDRQRGDAVASADAYLGPDDRNIFAGGSADYVVRDVFSEGGKPHLRGDAPCKPLRIVHAKWSGCPERIVHKLDSITTIHHPVHYVVVQVQAAVAQETVAGAAPPAPAIDPNAPTISVIMRRDLGDKRFPAFVFTMVCGTLFGLAATTLHRRDKVIAPGPRRDGLSQETLPMAQYLPLLTLLVLAVGFCVVSALVSRLVSPKRPTAAKSAPYECGIVPRRDPPDRFPVRFYLVAMIFIIFDIEIIFLYPYAVLHRQLGAFGVGEMVTFAVSVFAAFVYLIGNGALDWGPARRARAVEDPAMVSATRTSSATVRRVGTEGRVGVAAAAATTATAAVATAAGPDAGHTRPAPVEAA